MAKRYYAVELRGTDPACIKTVYEFDSESIREDWISEVYENMKYYSSTEFGNVVSLKPAVVSSALKHFHPVKVGWRSNSNWATNLSIFAGEWVYEK